MFSRSLEYTHHGVQKSIHSLTTYIEYATGLCEGKTLKRNVKKGKEKEKIDAGKRKCVIMLVLSPSGISVGICEIDFPALSPTALFQLCLFMYIRGQLNLDPSV